MLDSRLPVGNPGQKNSTDGWAEGEHEPGRRPGRHRLARIQIDESEHCQVGKDIKKDETRQQLMLTKPGFHGELRWRRMDGAVPDVVVNACVPGSATKSRNQIPMHTITISVPRPK